MNYKQASFELMHRRIYGIGVHWTTWTMPKNGKPLSFPEAVKRFDVKSFVEQLIEAGARYALFTVTHALHYLPGPNPEVDRIMPGRTCERDLIMDLAESLEKYGIPLVLYYNHGVQKINGHKTVFQDPRWQHAVGALEDDRSRFYDNYCSIIGWMGEHYGEKVLAYWFDSGYEHAKYDDTPWKRFAHASKAGYPDRLLTYNSGIAELESYTPFQDYWSGELIDLTFKPKGRKTPAGLPWHAFVTWHKSDNGIVGKWGFDEKSVKEKWNSPSLKDVSLFVSRFKKCGGAVTFNLPCYQDGSLLESDIAILHEFSKQNARF